MDGDRSEMWDVCRVVFERDAQGQILNQIGYNRADRRIYTLHYVNPNQAEYKTAEWIINPVRESGIALLKFSRPERGPEAGLVQEIRYFDSAGTPQPDRDGTYGNRYMSTDAPALCGRRLLRALPVLAGAATRSELGRPYPLSAVSWIHSVASPLYVELV